MLLLQIRIGCFIAKCCKFSLPFQYWHIFFKILISVSDKTCLFYEVCVKNM
jgi:hypothetical protein